MYLAIFIPPLKEQTTIIIGMGDTNTNAIATVSSCGWVGGGFRHKLKKSCSLGPQIPNRPKASEFSFFNFMSTVYIRFYNKYIYILYI